MTRNIVYVLGTSYSGSSLLNSLLDTQPQTRGIGEAVHLLKRPTNAWCSRCQGPVEGCLLEQAVRPSEFYESVFEAYPDANTIVNSSKNWKLCFQAMPIPDESFRLRMVLLSKTPEEFAHSFTVHEPCAFESAFDIWYAVYERLIGNLERVLNQQPNDEVQAALAGRICREDIHFVGYRDLAAATDQTMQSLCDGLELSLDENYRQHLWRGDTCVIGGNNAIYAQRTENNSFFDGQPEYLNGKYDGRRGSIFYDDQWRRSAELRRTADQWRKSESGRLSELEFRIQKLTSQTEVNWDPE